MKNNKIIDLTKQNSLIITSNINELIKDINSNISIIYFGDNGENSNIVEIVSQYKNIRKFILISEKNVNTSNSNIIFAKKISNNIIKEIEGNIIILVKLNNDYNHIKFIIKNIIEINELSLKYNKHIGVLYEDKNIIASLMNEDSIYIEDFLHSLEAISITTKGRRYEYIYDNVCNYLDKKFAENNFCDFCNDQCILNRKATNRQHKTMGCCYSFDYAGLFSFSLVKNVKLCQYMKNRTCETKNITCKLFTCKYLKEKGIKFDIHKILLLECFFNKKQQLIITSNFFRTREEILQKLLENNNIPYCIYYTFAMYRIKD